MNDKFLANEFVEFIYVLKRVWFGNIILVFGVYSFLTKSSVDRVNATNNVFYAMSRNMYIFRTKDVYDYFFFIICKLGFNVRYLLFKIIFGDI